MIPWPVNVYYDPPTQATLYVSNHIGGQLLTLKCQVGYKVVQILLDTSASSLAYISESSRQRLGMVLEQVPRQMPGVDPTEFSTFPPTNNPITLADGS